MACLVNLSNIYTIANPFKLYDNVKCWQLTDNIAEILKQYKHTLERKTTNIPGEYGHENHEQNTSKPNSSES